MELIKRLSAFILGLIIIIIDLYLISAVWHIVFWQVLIVEGIFILATLLIYVSLEDA
jgi:hypothetical protein